LRALVVTVDAYADPTLRLAHRGDDGDAIVGALERLARESYDDVDIVRLRDAGATRAAALAAADSLRARTTPLDTFVVYIGSHGAEVACDGREPEYRVLLHGVSRRPATRCTEAIAASELGAAIFEPSPAGRELLVLDTCESGGALTGSSKSGRAVRNLSYLAGFPVIAAARAGTIAREYESLGHGALTAALLEGLAGAEGAVRPDGTITAFSLADYVSKRVPSLSAAHPDAQLQRPVVSRGSRDFTLRAAHR
jgi:uncharacterized caspase-like protein